MTTLALVKKYPYWRNISVVLLILACYVVLLGQHISAIPGGCDSSGYFNQAQLLASGQVHVSPRTISDLQITNSGYLYSPLGFRPVGKDLAPTYATGLPLMLAVAKPLVGWRQAGNFVLIIHALAGLLLTYFLGRTVGLSSRWAATAATVIAVSPLYLFMSLQAMSDVPALVWTTAAVIAAWRSRDSTWLAAVAGAALAFDVLIRPSNLLALLPIAVALGIAPRRWILFGLGGLPGAVFFLAYNYMAYGNPLMTGYGNVGVEFSSAYIPVTLLHYAHWVPLSLSPLAILAIGLPWILRKSPRAVKVLGIWILAYTAFYACYKYTHETWWYLRFLLPVVPAIVVAGLLVAKHCSVQWSKRISAKSKTWIWIAILLIIITNGAFWTYKQHALDVGRDEYRYVAISDWVKDHVPSNAVFLAMQVSGALFYQTDFTILRWDSIQETTAKNVIAKIRQSGRPLYAVLFPFEKEEVLNKRFPGAWTQIGAVDDVTIWRWNVNSSS